MRIYSWIGFLFAFCCLACHDDDAEPMPAGDMRTVIVYLGVDNDFNGEDREKIDQLVAGWKASYDGHLLIYADPAGTPYLTEVSWENGKAVQKEVRRYEEQNSADPEVFRDVLTEIMKDYPAKSYGLIVLSHGSGWLPKFSLQHVRSIISDRNDEMEMKDFAEAIPGKMDFIVFDACFMGEIEVAYEFKDKTDYLVVSPAEVVVPGFVYSTMMKHLMKEEADVEAVARDFYEYFDKQKGDMRSATVSVVKTAELEELAVLCRELLYGRDGASEVDLRTIQNFGYGRHLLFFDFADYIRALVPDRYAEFEKVLDKCVVYKAHTPTYYSSGIAASSPIKEYSGLTIYIPQTEYPFLNSEYEKLKWTQRVNL